MGIWSTFRPRASAVCLVTGSLLFGSLTDGRLSAADAAATKIVAKAEDKMRGISAYARMEMKISKRRIQRTLQFDSWDDSKSDKFFIRILKPKKDRGTAFLKIGSNLYQYIPRIGREIKVEGSLMQNSWMGSDFNNDDLVRKTSVVDDYDHTLLGKTATGTKIQMIPDETAAVIWKKVIVVIDAESNYRSVEYYNQRDELVKKLIYSEIKYMGGRRLPTKMRMATLAGGREVSSTTIRYLKATFNKGIPGGTFSRANLRKGF